MIKFLWKLQYVKSAKDVHTRICYPLLFQVSYKSVRCTPVPRTATYSE